MLIHRTNIEKYWVTEDLPDNAVELSDGRIVITMGQGSVSLTAKSLKEQRQKVQAELTAQYGSWDIGEPVPTKFRSLPQLKENGLVGIYSRAKPGDAVPMAQVSQFVEKALEENPPDNTAERASQIVSGAT